jgi:hypothetical protein
MSEDRPVPGWWLSSRGSLRCGNPVVIGMHPFERGVQPGPLRGRHPGQYGLEVRPVLVPHRLRLEKQTDLRPQVRYPVRRHLENLRVRPPDRRVPAADPGIAVVRLAEHVESPPGRPARTPMSGATPRPGFRCSSGPACPRPAGPRSRSRESAVATSRRTRTRPRSPGPRGRAWAYPRRDRSPTHPPRTTGSLDPPRAAKSRGCQGSHASISGCIRSP